MRQAADDISFLVPRPVAGYRGSCGPRDKLGLGSGEQVIKACVIVGIGVAVFGSISSGSLVAGAAFGLIAGALVGTCWGVFR